MAEAPTSTSTVATVERFVPAPASAIFDVLADPSRHPEIDGSGTVREASDGSQRLSLGATFGMDMKAGIGYSMQNTVVEFDEDRLIAWQPQPTIGLLRLFVGGRIWRYELVPQKGGTLVRESWDIRRERNPWMVRPLRSKAVEGMTRTLERIETIVTAKQ